jgi:hypothetical protein
VIFPPSTYATCDGCGERVVATVTHSVKIGPASPGGPSRWVQWKECPACSVIAERIRDEQRRDEERERLEAQERATQAADRDRARNEKRTSSKQVPT